LIEHLTTTPVARNFFPYFEKRFFISNVQISSLKELGRLRTIFGDLGGIRSSSKGSAQKFTVSRVLPALKKPACTDKEGLESIRRFMDNLDEFPFLVTIVKDQVNYMIVDGDKHAVAFYEHSRKIPNEDEIDFRAFLISPK